MLHDHASFAPIPARYAVNQLLRDIRKDAGQNVSTQALYEEMKRRPLCGDRAMEILTGGAAGNPLIDAQKLHTKPKVHSIRTVSMLHDKIEDDVCVREMLFMRNERYDIRPREFEVRSSLLGTAVSRHAVERLYEREELRHSELLARLKTDLASVWRRVAFAHAAGLMRIPYPDPCDPARYGTRTPGAIGVIPLGAGALTLRAARIDVAHNPCTRFAICKGGRRELAGDMHSSTSVFLDPTGRNRGYFITIGTTYLSRDLLQPDQLDYVDLMEREMERHDLDGLAADVGRLWLPHERPAPPPCVQVDPQLHAMLRRITVRPQRSTPMRRAERDTAPAQTERPMPHHHHLNWQWR